MTGELAATSGHHAATLAGAIVNTLRVPLLKVYARKRVNLPACRPVDAPTLHAHRRPALRPLMGP